MVQVKAWLSENGVEAESLWKKDVAKLIDNTDGQVEEALRHCFIVGHVHDELIIECNPDVNLNVICRQMGKSPDWMPDILLRADGCETPFYKKD